MKNRITDKARLYHISDAIKNIEEFMTGVDYETYMNDFKLRLALIKLFEIIGEASNGISRELQDEFSDIEWSVLNGIRNILVHEYFGIDYDIIWDTIKNKIPELNGKISAMIKQLP